MTEWICELYIRHKINMIGVHSTEVQSNCAQLC